MINDEQLSAAVDAINNFDWHNFNAHAPDDDGDGAWMSALARAVLQSQRGVPRWQPVDERGQPTTSRVEPTDRQIIG